MFVLLQDQFYWPGMTKDVELQIANCKWCIQFKVNHKWAEMENIQATYPLQWEHLDYLTIEMTECGKDAHMLIITDHFMRYAQALVTSSQTAKYTAQALWDWFVIHYGLPESNNFWLGSKFWVTLFYNCASFQQYRKYILANTIHRQMDNVNGLIIH